MRILTLTTFFSVLFLVLLAPAFLTLGIRYIPNADQPPLEKTQAIYWTHSISQSFISQKPRLTGIAMSIKNPNLENDKDIQLELYEDDILVRSSVINGKNIGDGAFVKFLFDEISDSLNKEYVFILSAPTAREEFALEPFYTQEKPDWARELTFDEGEVEASLSFVTFHRPESRVGLINEIYQDWFNRFYADKVFFFFYSGLLVILLVVFLI